MEYSPQYITLRDLHKRSFGTAQLLSVFRAGEARLNSLMSVSKVCFRIYNDCSSQFQLQAFLSKFNDLLIQSRKGVSVELPLQEESTAYYRSFSTGIFFESFLS